LVRPQGYKDFKVLLGQTIEEGRKNVQVDPLMFQGENQVILPPLSPVLFSLAIRMISGRLCNQAVVGERCRRVRFFRSQSV
jgi:hypothetical protein